MNKIMITKNKQLNTQKINTNKTKFYNSQYWYLNYLQNKESNSLTHTQKQIIPNYNDNQIKKPLPQI